MNNIIEQMLSKYEIKNTNDEINALKEIIQEIVLSGLSRGNFFDEVAFYGGSFTGIDVELQDKLLQAAYDYIKEKKVHSIRISTRPDYIDKTILKRLKKYKVKRYKK